MEVEFMTADTTLPPCMPLPRAMLRLPISSTAKVMYARMLDIVFLSGIEDANGILFIHFPIVELAAALARSTMTVKRSLNELEDAGLILRVRQGFGEPNKIYILIPGKEDSRLSADCRTGGCKDFAGCAPLAQSGFAIRAVPPDRRAGKETVHPAGGQRPGAAYPGGTGRETPAAPPPAKTGYGTLTN